jgi:UDP-glucose 4-epimerase
MKDLIVITGAAGYLGGRIAQYLAEKSYWLRLATHSPIKKPTWLQHGEMVSFDLSLNNFNDICHEASCVLHLAALNDQACVRDPEAAFKINCVGTYYLLEAAKQEKVKKFIYFSTAHVYGAPLEGRFTEKSLVAPRNIYSITHKAAEDLVLSENRSPDFCGLVVRLANSFGAPVFAEMKQWNLLANDLCRQAVVHKEIILKSNGQQRRNFIPLTDVCLAAEHFIKLPANEKDNGIFNLGWHQSFKVIEIAKLVAERCKCVLGYMPKITIASAEAAAPTGSYSLDYCIDKLLASGFSLNSDFTEEIDNCLKFCDKYCGGK